MGGCAALLVIGTGVHPFVAVGLGRPTGDDQCWQQPASATIGAGNNP
jgi:hypothetical protein